MATRPDLNLPSRAPSIERLHNQAVELLPVALYTLVSLSDAELTELQEDCEQSKSPTQSGANIRLAPRPRFIGEDLRAVFDYHLQLGHGNVFDPIYFLVAFEKDWKSNGILIITLDDDDLDCNVDKFCTFAPDAGLTIVNLQISNVDWSEAKEDSLPFPGATGDEEDNEDDDNGNDEQSDASEDDNGDSGGVPEVPNQPPPAGSFCGVYVVEGADADDVLFNLRPGASMTGATQDRTKWPVSLQGTLAPSLHLIDHAFDLHPSRCRRNKWLYKDLFFLVDSTDPIEKGILLCQLSQRRAQRAPFNAYEALQDMYFGIKMGNRPWSLEIPLFLVYRDSFAREVPIQLLSKSGGSFLTPGDISAGKQLCFNRLDEAIRWFPFHCRQNRFKSNLKTDYFICIPKDWERGVLLVHVNWDYDLSLTADEIKTLDLTDKVESVRCPISKVYTIWKDVSEGKKTWHSLTMIGK